LKFSDVVWAMSSIWIIAMLIEGPLMSVMVPAVGLVGIFITVWIGVFIAAIVVGIVFSGKIWEESRIGTIAKMTVLSTVLVQLSQWIAIAATGSNFDTFKTQYIAANPTKDLTGFLWCTVAVPQTFLYGTLGTVMYAVLIFVGLYFSSMLRKPKTN